MLRLYPFLLDTCHRFSIRLQVATNGDAGDFAAVQLWQRDQKRFSLNRRLPDGGYIGPIFERVGDTPGEFTRREYDGSIERRDAEGQSVALELNPGPDDSSLWYYEKRHYPALVSTTPVGTDDNNTTWANRDWVKSAAKVLIYKYLARRDRVEAPSRWNTLIPESINELEVAQKDHGIKPMFVEDNPKPVYRATRRV